MSRFNDGHGYPADQYNDGYPADPGYHNTAYPAAGAPGGGHPFNNNAYPAHHYPADSSDEGYRDPSPYNDGYKGFDKEKGYPVAGEPIGTDAASSDFADIDPNSGVKRGLKTRHLSMMALAGIIGPGLLVGAGGALAKGGPASLLIGFGVIGIIAFFVMQSLGELTTLYPTGGAFTGLADRFVDKSFGVALGWNYFIIWFCVLANEYNVICSVFREWGPQVPLWGYFLIFWVSLETCARG